MQCKLPRRQKQTMNPPNKLTHKADPSADRPEANDLATPGKRAIDILIIDKAGYTISLTS